MRQDLTPLQVCTRLLGAYPALARVVGYGEKAPYLWEKPASNREAGDLPSARIMRALLDHSDRHGLGLTAEHLIWGASEAEVAAILQARARGVAA